MDVILDNTFFKEYQLLAYRFGYMFFHPFHTSLIQLSSFPDGVSETGSHLKSQALRSPWFGQCIHAQTSTRKKLCVVGSVFLALMLLLTAHYCAAAVPTCTLAASPSTIHVGQSSTLIASCSPAATSYAWTNTGFPTTIAIGTVSPTVTTTYSVVGSNATGSGNRASATVTVCTYHLSSTSETVPFGGRTGSISVTSLSECAWSATSNVDWITITSGSSGNGNGTVAYLVAANTGIGLREGNLTVAGQPFTVTQAGINRKQIDFNGDGKADILGQRSTSGEVAIWLLDGPSIVSGRQFATVPASSGWRIAGVGDFDGDGKTDIFWRHLDGFNFISFMNGEDVARLVATTPATSETMQPAAVADFDGDGKADILWRLSNGSYTTWFMNGEGRVPVQPGAGNLPAPPGAAAEILAVGDVNGDGRADIIWRNTNGLLTLWTMNGATVMPESSGAFGIVPASMGWEVVGSGDFNADGKMDLVWRNTNGVHVLLFLDGRSLLPTSGVIAIAPDSIGWYLAGVGDFNGDGYADILWRSVTGEGAIWTMNGTQVTGSTLLFSLPIPEASAWRVIGPDP